jgi:uncharacterized protein YciI
MLVLVTLSYRVPLAEVDVHTPAHRAYLKTLFDAKKLIASGPFVPREGGALLLRVESEDEVKAIIAADPFSVNGIADYLVRVWSPTFGADALASL